MSHCPAFTGLSHCLWCQRRANKQPSPAWWKTPPRNFAWWEKSHVSVVSVTITLTLRKQTLTDQTHFKRGFVVVLLRLFVYCGSSFCVLTFVFISTRTRAAASEFTNSSDAQWVNLLKRLHKHSLHLVLMLLSTWMFNSNLTQIYNFYFPINVRGCVLHVLWLTGKLWTALNCEAT